MIHFISSKDPQEGVAALSGKISGYLNDGKKVLWLVCGGSNVPIAIEVMNAIRSSVSPERISNLTVTQTDERFGAVGHPDSNWQQMKEGGFDLDGVTTLPILTGLPLGETVTRYSDVIEKAFEENEVRIGQFGMGTDGHIAGLVPHSPALYAAGHAAEHTDENFTRVTVTPVMFESLTAAYAFVFGASKREAVLNLKNKELSLDDQPAQLLKVVGEVWFYSDVLG